MFYLLKFIMYHVLCISSLYASFAYATIADNLLPKIASTQIIQQRIIKTMLKNYDWRVRPHGMNESWNETGGPVLIKVNIYFRSISKIDDVNMEYSTQFTFREEWTDNRLAYENLIKNMSNSTKPKFVILVPDDKSQQIWMPDTFFQNEKAATRHFVDKPNVMIRIYPNGSILYSVRNAKIKLKQLQMHGRPGFPFRLSLTLSCHMNLADYPLDKQLCLIDMASYAYTTDDIIYEWKRDNPVQMKDTVNTSLPSFALERVMVSYCSSKTTTGEYSCLRTELYLRRLFSYYLVRLYIPTFLLVVVSWVSFWLDKTSAPARVTLGITTLLTMTTQASDLNSKLHPVSYMKAIDVWVGVCLAFVFGALLEFALINFVSNELKSKKKRKSSLEDEEEKCKTKLIINWQSDVKPRQTMLHSPLLPLDDVADVWKRRAYEYPMTSEDDISILNQVTEMEGALIHNQSHGFFNFKPWLKEKIEQYKDRAKLIDMLSRIVFPFTFLTFNAFYWAIYL